MDLQLSLKEKWFSMTKSEYKKEDYREITPYWCNRLLLYLGESKTKRWWENEFFDCGTLEERIENIELFCDFKKFNNNIMTLGYPKSTDQDRILKYKHGGIEIREGKEEWGAKKGVQYFVIKHG